MAQAEMPTVDLVTPELFRDELTTSAFAFRGYNVTNLGMTPELLEHPAYQSIIEKYLHRGSQICSDVKGRPVDLVHRVKNRLMTKRSP